MKIVMPNCVQSTATTRRFGVASLPHLSLKNWLRMLGIAPPRVVRVYSTVRGIVVKTGGRLVKHARYYWLMLAEGHLNRRWFGTMLGCIARLPAQPG